jgi:hypothetical protein
MPKEPGREIQHRLASAIREEVKHAGSFDALANRIREETESRIDRRKLKRIADAAIKNDDVPLSFSELQILDDFLAPRQRALSSLFKRGVPDALLEQGNVTIILGSQPRDHPPRIDFSRWDIRGTREVLLALNGTGRAFHFDLEDVIFRHDSHREFAPGQDVGRNETWYHLLHSDHGPSTICIGSPKACHASELMLAKMFGVVPFQRWSDPDREAPFLFIWSKDEPHRRFRSAFRMEPAALRRHNPELYRRVMSSNSKQPVSAVFTGGEFCEVARSRTSWDTYALIAVQRQPHNQVWAVIAGLTGPATFGACRLFDSLSADLHANSGVSSHTVWATVRVRVEMQPTSERYRSDKRHIVNQEVVSVGFWATDPG